MKTVFNNSDLAHKFAQQLQHEGRSGSMFFEGSKMYSYGRHFCLAHFINPETVLINSRSYSMTTSRHQSITRQALSHKNLIFCPYPEESQANTILKNKNFEYWEREARAIVEKLTKAKKPVKYLSELNYIKGLADKFSEVTGLPITEILANYLSITDKEESKKAIEQERQAKQKKQSWKPM